MGKFLRAGRSNQTKGAAWRTDVAQTILHNIGGSGADPSGPIRALKTARANGRPLRDDHHEVTEPTCLSRTYALESLHIDEDLRTH
jgi:hypothetical protein